MKKNSNILSPNPTPSNILSPFPYSRFLSFFILRLDKINSFIHTILIYISAYPFPSTPPSHLLSIPSVHHHFLLLSPSPSPSRQPPPPLIRKLFNRNLITFYPGYSIHRQDIRCTTIMIILCLIQYYYLLCNISCTDLQKHKL